MTPPRKTATTLTTLALIWKALADRGLMLILRLGNKDGNGFVCDMIFDRNRPDYDAIIDRARQIRKAQTDKETHE